MFRSGTFQLFGVLTLALLYFHNGISATTAPYQSRNNDEDCKCMPGDACWPSVEEWTALNSSLSGKLVETIPLGSPCHVPTYVEAECLHLKQQWFRPDIQ